MSFLFYLGPSLSYKCLKLYGATWDTFPVWYAHTGCSTIMYHIWILNEIFCFWSVMCFLAACSTECFAILADTLRVTFCYGSSEKRLVNQSRPILSENEIDYFDTTTIKEALCNSQCSNTQNNVANYRETTGIGHVTVKNQNKGNCVCEKEPSLQVKGSKSCRLHRLPDTQEFWRQHNND